MIELPEQLRGERVLDLQARRMWASCDSANLASWKVLERCGFRREAHLLRERVDHHGRLRDTFIYALTT